MDSWLNLVRAFPSEVSFAVFLEVGFGSGIDFCHCLLGSPPGGELILKFCTCMFRKKLLKADFSPFQSVRNDSWSDVRISFQAQSQFMNVCKCMENSTIWNDYRNTMLDFSTCRHVSKTQPPGYLDWPVLTLRSYFCSSYGRTKCFQCCLFSVSAVKFY